MASVSVTSQVAGSEPQQEFFDKAPNILKAIVLLLEHEERVVNQSWLAEVAFLTGMNQDEEGFSFTMVDTGSDPVITYTYVFTA